MATRQRREVLTALTAAYMLVQLSSLPVALSLPSIAEYFGTEIDDAAWIVVVYLMVLGSLVLLAARDWATCTATSGCSSSALRWPR